MGIRIHIVRKSTHAQYAYKAQTKSTTHNAMQSHSLVNWYILHIEGHTQMLSLEGSMPYEIRTGAN